MQNILTEDVLFLINLLDGKARLVGGSVRDMLSDIPVHDIDIATELPPDEVVERLTQANVRIMTAGITHGTVMAIIHHTPYEITTLRQDIETDGRHANISFTHSYEQDAKRRDFTINALYMDKDGKIYDYTGGQTDLKNGLVRFIGHAKTRVQEDYLRILRYFRFWGKLGCGQTDAEALDACQAFADRLSQISNERKQHEMMIILSDRNCDKVLNLMHTHNVLPHILPHADIPSLSAFLAVCPNCEPEEKLAVLTQGNLPTFPLSKAQKKLIMSFIKPHSFSSDITQEKLSLYHMGQRVYHFHIYQALAQNKISKSLADTLLQLTRPIFPLTGQDFIDLGFSTGPTIKKCLQIAETAWALNGFSTDKKLVLNQFLVYNKK